MYSRPTPGRSGVLWDTVSGRYVYPAPGLARRCCQSVSKPSAVPADRERPSEVIGRRLSLGDSGHRQRGESV